MKMWVWKSVNKVSDNWHPDGGLLVVAADEYSARELIANAWGVAVSEEEWPKAQVFELLPGVHPQLMVFPDAGCC